MSESLSVAEAKSRFSELLGRVSIGKERFVIEKHGKPVGAIVGIEDLTQLEARADAKPGGLLATVGLFADFDEWEEIMEEVMRSRQDQIGREISVDFE